MSKFRGDIMVDSKSGNVIFIVAHAPSVGPYALLLFPDDDAAASFDWGHGDTVGAARLAHCLFRICFDRPATDHEASVLVQELVGSLPTPFDLESGSVVEVFKSSQLVQITACEIESCDRNL